MYECTISILFHKNERHAQTWCGNLVILAPRCRDISAGGCHEEIRAFKSRR